MNMHQLKLTNKFNVKPTERRNAIEFQIVCDKKMTNDVNKCRAAQTKRKQRKRSEILE